MANRGEDKENKRSSSISVLGKKRGRPKKDRKSGTLIYRCPECSFESPRTYNVMRHHQRIHQPTKKWKTCCDLKFISKSDYYWHCDEFHPTKRKYTLMSKFKYKITKENDNEEVKNVENRQFCERRLRSRIREASGPRESSLEASDAKSIISRKSEIPKSKGVEIFFHEGMKNVSPELAKIQSDYLTDIDFESFKLDLPSQREVRIERKNSIKGRKFYI